MPLTQYARDQALSYAFTATVLTRPTAWHLGLFTAFPGDLGTSFSNEFTSGSSSSYARVQMTGGNGLALSSHIISNGGAVTVGPAVGSWQTATFYGIFDASSAGNLWAYAELAQNGASFFLASAQAAAVGSGYAVNDTITPTGGGGAILTVDAVATVSGVAGVPVRWHVSTAGSVSSIPANPMATTSSGAGTGFTALASWLLAPQSFQLNNGDTMTFATGQLQITAG